MTVSDIKLEMKFNGVNETDIEAIISACKMKGYGSDTLDEELEKRGYDRIFSIDYDDEDAWEEDDDDFAPMEPFPHKHRFDDDWKR